MYSKFYEQFWKNNHIADICSYVCPTIHAHCACLPRTLSPCICLSMTFAILSSHWNVNVASFVAYRISSSLSSLCHCSTYHLEYGRIMRWTGQLDVCFVGRFIELLNCLVCDFLHSTIFCFWQVIGRNCQKKHKHKYLQNGIK